MTQIRTPDLTDNWVMLGFENGENPIVAIYTDDSALWDLGGEVTPIQRRIMALRLRHIAALIEPKPTPEGF